MITLKLDTKLSPSTQTTRTKSSTVLTLLIHKPRTSVAVRQESFNQFCQSNNCTINISDNALKASASEARNLCMANYLLVSKAIYDRSIYHKPFHLLHGLNSNSRTSFKFIPSSHSINYHIIQNNTPQKSSHVIYVANARDIFTYLAFEKLAQNPHLLPIISDDYRYTMQFIAALLRKVVQ